ncbi:hypothetical protein ACFVRT_15975 [Arthrobacter koreensis]|uniref:hypothetical protein n=1 Tax=Arthrobacter koreensis TaxID=199136 RepID=UPI0036DF43E8
MTVKDVFGDACEDTYANLNWAGREESLESSARRLAASMSVLSVLTGLQWYRDAEDLQSRTAHFVAVPSDPGALADILRARLIPDWGDAAAAFRFLLSREAPSLKNTEVAALSGSVGSAADSWNQIKLELADDFPLGGPVEAASLFAELVRIWQPDHARLSNYAVQKELVMTRAAYLSWTSNKSYEEPASDLEVSIPFGDGNLRAASVWTPGHVVALNAELASAGAPGFSKRPAQQDPPQFPSEAPDLASELSTVTVPAAAGE